jgi:hypothetical protein
MKKILLASALVGSLVLPIITMAISDVEVPELNGSQMMEIINRITNWLFAFLIIVAVVSIIIAGYYFITAQGDAEKVKTARNFILYALIGVGVGLLAKGLVGLVGFITGQNFNVW